MNLSSNPARNAYLRLEIESKLKLRIKIENFQRGVLTEKLATFELSYTLVSSSAFAERQLNVQR